MAARFAPDGQTIVYGAAWDGRPLEIFTTRADSAESRSLGLPGADLLAVSSTGELAISLASPLHLRLPDGRGRSRACRWPGARRARSSRTSRTPTGLPTARISPCAASVGNREPRRVPDRQGPLRRRRAGSATSASRRTAASSPSSTIRRSGNNDGHLRIVDTNGKVRLERPVRQHRRHRLVAGGRRNLVERGYGSGVIATTLSGKSRRVWLAPRAERRTTSPATAARSCW